MPNPSGKFCKARTKDGQPCKAPPTEGGLCYFHANPDKARTLGQKGGRKNRYQVTDVAVPNDGTSASLSTVVHQTLAELLAGRVDPRRASAVAQLVNTLRRLTETVGLENRVSELEHKLSDLGGSPSKPPNRVGDEFEMPLWWQKGETEEGEGKNLGGENGEA